MSIRLRAFVVVGMAISLTFCGCGKDESQPNPDLKVPDVKPSSRRDKSDIKKDTTGPKPTDGQPQGN